MSYILYGDKDSGSFTAEALFAEIGVPYELRGIDLAKYEETEDAFKAINPAGKLPTLLLPDGTVVTESAAILLTISARHAEAKLFPDLASSDGAWALRWLMFISNNIYEAVGRVEFPNRYTSNYYDRSAIEASAKSEIRWFWMLFERELEDRGRPGPYALGGDQFSALDIYVANIAAWFNPIEWRAPNAPRIEAIRRAVAQRAKIVPVWARHFDPV
ncbi:MAG: glutathione S-transferase family protein [Alphaproteobacteria bacterium]|nr:glutathione S-transferase family protein [Alphaproteobacteria bacterium]